MKSDPQIDADYSVSICRTVLGTEIALWHKTDTKILRWDYSLRWSFEGIFPGSKIGLMEDD